MCTQKTGLAYIFFNFRLESEVRQLQSRLSDDSEIVAQNRRAIDNLESNLSLSNAEFSSLKIEAAKRSAKILDLKSEIKIEQLKNKHLLDRSTERLAELEDLRKKLKNNDDVIVRLETNVADKNRHIGHIKKDLIDQEKQFQKVLDKKDDQIQNLTSALREKQVQQNTLDGELKLKDILIERLRLDLVHREGSIENLKKENELLIHLQADKKAETKSSRVIFF